MGKRFSRCTDPELTHGSTILLSIPDVSFNAHDPEHGIGIERHSGVPNSIYGGRVDCKLLTNSKQLPAFPLEAVREIEPRHQRWEARVLPLCHCGPSN